MITDLKIIQNKFAGELTHLGKKFRYEYVQHASPNSCSTILLGGVLQDMTSWKNYVKEFSKENSVITVDLPGIGSSEILTCDYSFDFLADCLALLVDHLQLKQVNLFATSYSTIIGFEFARRHHSKIGKLAISSSMTEIPNEQINVMMDCIIALEKKDIESFKTVFVQGISNTHNKAENFELIQRVIQSGIQNMTDLQISQFIENTKRVLNYTIPINLDQPIPLTPLIFTGELDNFTPPHLCKKIGAYFEDFNFRIIPNLDHLFHIGNNKLIFANLIPYFKDDIIPDFCASKPIDATLHEKIQTESTNQTPSFYYKKY